jgi:hypothetical protein
MSLRSWLGLEPKPIVPDLPAEPDEAQLGVRSPYVLAKIGNDLRHKYHDLLEQPLPDEILKVAARLPGASVVLPFPADPKSEI